MAKKANCSRRRTGNEIACCVALILAQSAWAQQQRFNIPETDAVKAIPEFARQAGLQIVAPADDLKGIRTVALNGEIDARDALKRLLEGTGLEIASDDGALITLRKIDSRESLRISAANPQVAGREPMADDLEEIVVQSRVIFTENDAFGATKMGLALKDTPQSVLVVTSDLIDTTGMQGFNDLYKVDASGGTSHAIDGYPRNYYRGFLQQGRNAIRVDGFRMPGNINLDLAPLDRIEVIKGAVSTLYGQSSIGGTLNAVSKQPQDKFGAELSLEGGQFSYRRIDADVTGPIGSSDALSYRVIGAWREGGSFLDFGKEDLKLVSASVRYQPSEATTVMLRASFQDHANRRHSATALQLVGDGTGDPAVKIADFPRSRFFGMPWNLLENDVGILQAQVEHHFANRWTLRTNVQYNRTKYASNAFAVGGPFDQNGDAAYGIAYGTDNDDDLYGGEINLFGSIDLLGREHTLFLGADFSRSGSDAHYGQEFFPGGTGSPLFNVFNPDYGAVSPRSLDNYPGLYDFDTETELYGGTVQLVIDPVDRVKILLGGRFSTDTLLFRSRNGTQPTGGDDINNKDFVTGTDLSFHNFTTQTGVTYELTPQVNLYASYGETFEPNTARAFVAGAPAGKLIDPEEGTNYEIGAKAELSRDLAMTLALFQAERTNITQGDPLNPGFSLPLGTQRSRGVELGAQGRLSPAFSLFGSMAYLNAEFSEGEFKGFQPANAPRFGLSVFGNYEILSGDLKGLGFGLGVVHKEGLKTFDRFWIQSDGKPLTFDFGSFTEVDASIDYQRARWNLSLTVSNLLNEEYYSPIGNYLSGAIHVNPPRTLRARIRYKF